jgi:tetratricopeptide (TPR) repeat protein
VASSADPAAAARVDAVAATGALLMSIAGPQSTAGSQLLFPTDAFLDDGAAKAPVLPLARYAPGFSLIHQGKFDEAVSALEAAAAADPLVAGTSPELLVAAGALRAGDASGAIERLTSIIASYPGSGQAHRILGLAFEASGNTARAVSELQTAIQIDPADERARTGLASVLGKAGRIADARTTLRETVQRLPQAGQAYGRLGALALAGGDWPEAIGHFEHVAALRPVAGGSMLFATLGRLYAQQPDLDSTVRAYRARAALLPHDATAHADLGGAYRAAGRTDEALVEYLAAALLDRGNAGALASTGQLLAALGRDAEAVTVLQHAVTLDPRHREAQYALSRALTRLGRSDEAAEHLRVYDQLQAAAMDEQRRRFESNTETIEELLKRPTDGTTGR